MSDDRCFPEAVELDAYGNGGFRFAEMSHKGSILILPSGIYGWGYSSFEEVDLAAFETLFNEEAPPEFLIFGTGDRQKFPSPELRAAFEAAGIGLEVMDTGAAARTYNVLIAEERQVAAALIAVA